jgi:putative membrane protein
MSIPFTEEELASLRGAVKDAEGGTAGEIVVYVVPKSGSYEAVLWRGGAVGLVFGIVLSTAFALIWRAWGQGWLWSPAFSLALIAAGSLAGAFLARAHGRFFRLVAGTALLETTAKRRARRAFMEEGVMETAARTGVLLFVSVMERRIEVLADKGITSRVPESSWTDIVEVMRGELRRGNLVAGLSEGILAVGKVLRASGVGASADDRNELGDDIRFEAD